MIRRLFEAWHYSIWLLTVAVPGRLLYWLEPVGGFVANIAFQLGACAERVAMRLTSWDWPRPVHNLVWLTGAAVERLSVWIHTRNWQLPRSLRFLVWLSWWGVVWIRTRSLRYLLQGMPAMLVAGMIGLVLFAQAIKPAIRDVERYRIATQSALLDKDYEAADVWQRKLLQLGVDDAESRYDIAIVAHYLGKHAKAERIIDELTPDDSVGYPRAHLWKAQRLSNQLDAASPEAGDRLIHHLEAALESTAKTDALVMLGRVYARRGERDKAIEHLMKVSKARPEVELVLGQLYAQYGDHARAERRAVLAIRHFRDQLKADSEKHKVRIALAQALQIIGRWHQAEAVLIDGVGREPRQLFQDPLAALYVAHYDTLENRKLADRLALVDMALTVAPNHAGALQRLAELAKDDAAAKSLNLLLAAGSSPAASHMLLAVNASQDRAANIGHVHLRQAARANQHSAAILNNLAWVFLRDGDVERALLIVNLALDLAPEEPHIRNTRGHVLARFQQWDKAVDDLIFSLTELDLPATHAMLAVAYEKLGDPNKAQLHRELANPDSDAQVLEN